MVDIWSIFGRYLVNFVVVDIYYNPTGRSANEDQFSSLVLMRTKSLIEYLYAATALWTVLYPNQKVVARIYSNRYVEYCLHYRILLKLQDVSNEGNINGIKLSLNFFCAVFSLNIQRLISGQRSTRI